MPRRQCIPTVCVHNEMGRRKPFVEQELTFAPKISRASKRIADRLRLSDSEEGVPRFMKSTKSKKLTLEPIAVESLSHRSRDSPKLFEGSDNLENVLGSTKSVLPSLTATPDSGATGNVVTAKLAVLGEEDGLKTIDPFNNAMSKNAYLAPKALQLDENVFTFRPKVSSASAKIAESLGTDFMARQQMHIEKQKRLVSFKHFIYF